MIEDDALNWRYVYPHFWHVVIVIVVVRCRCRRPSNNKQLPQHCRNDQAARAREYENCEDKRIKANAARIQHTHTNTHKTHIASVALVHTLIRCESPYTNTAQQRQ